MTDEEILEGNKLIVKFLNIKESILYYDSYGISTPVYKILHKLYSGNSYKIPNKSLEVFIENCKYHSSWDWLIPCIDKIYESPWYYKWKDTSGQFEKEIFINTKFIEVTWEQVVEFIRWYNTQKND